MSNQAQTSNLPLTPEQLASLRESKPPYHHQRELERLREELATIKAAHGEIRDLLGHARDLVKGLAEENNRLRGMVAKYVAAGLEPPEVLE